MLTNGMKTSIEPTPPRVLAWESVAIALQREASDIRARNDADHEPGIRRSGAQARPCAACQQQHSAEMLATCEHPRQSLAVSAAMQTAGRQLQSEQRIVPSA